MIALRFVLAVLLVIAGCVVLVRMLSLGLHADILPGVALAAAMIALGVHRIALIRRVRRST